MKEREGLRLCFAIFALITIFTLFVSKICIANDESTVERRYCRIENRILESKGKRGYFDKIIREYCSSLEKKSFAFRGHIYDTLTGKPVNNIRVRVILSKSYRMSFFTDGPMYFFAKKWSHKPLGKKIIKAYKKITDSNGYFEFNIHKKYIDKAEQIGIYYYPKRIDMHMDTYQIYKIENNEVLAEVYIRRFDHLFEGLYFREFAQRTKILKDMNLTELYPLQDIIEKVLEKHGYRKNIDEFFELSEKFLRETYPSHFLDNDKK